MDRPPERLGQGEECSVGIFVEPAHCNVSLPQQRRYGGSRDIADPQPDHLRWRAEHKTTLVEVGVFRYQQESLLGCVCPYSLIRRAKKPNIPHVCRIRIFVSQLADQKRGSRRTEASRRRREQAPLAISRKGESGADGEKTDLIKPKTILGSQIRNSALASYRDSPHGAPASGEGARSCDGSALEAFFEFLGEGRRLG